jgi:hypothetical protein
MDAQGTTVVAGLVTVSLAWLGADDRRARRTAPRIRLARSGGCAGAFGRPAGPTVIPAARVALPRRRRRPRGAPTPPGPLIDADDRSSGRPPKRAQSPRIPSNPKLSPRFQALVLETERDRRRSAAISKTTKASRMQGFLDDGARGTRTPDLLGAIQHPRCENAGEKCPVSSDFASRCVWPARVHWSWIAADCRRVRHSWR